MSKIKCEICESMEHAIPVHLKNAHPQWDQDRYHSKFPNAPLFSEEAKQMMEQRRKEKLESFAGNGKAAFDELFEIEGRPGALSARGSKIVIDVLGAGEHQCRVPLADANYVPCVELLKDCVIGIEMNIPVLVYGPAGIGKTSIFKHICAKTNRPMVRVQHVCGMETSSVIGEKTVVKQVADDGTIHTFIDWEHGPLPLAMLNGWMYVADEMDRATPEVNSIYQAVLEGESLYIPDAPEHLRTIKPHPSFRFVATGNTNGSGDESGIHRATQLQDAATFERFGIVVKAEYPDKATELMMLRRAAGVPDKVGQALCKFAEKIREMHPSEISLTIGPRVLINIAKLGSARADYAKGVEHAFANRLRDAERQAVLDTAKKMLAL